MISRNRIPPHAPEVGRARQLLGDYHVTGLFWYRFHNGAVSTLPAWTLWPITITFTTFFFCTIFKIRRAIASNLQTAVGPCGFLERQRRIYTTMWTFGWCLTERYERLTTDRHFELTIEAIEHWNAVASADRASLRTGGVGAHGRGADAPRVRDPRGPATVPRDLLPAGFRASHGRPEGRSDLGHGSRRGGRRTGGARRAASVVRVARAL